MINIAQDHGVKSVLEKTFNKGSCEAIDPNVANIIKQLEHRHIFIPISEVLINEICININVTLIEWLNQNQ